MALVEEQQAFDVEAGASIPRASSNLELLCKTAAWKNDMERDPVRVSPTDLHSKCSFSPPSTPIMPISKETTPEVTKSPTLKDAKLTRVPSLAALSPSLSHSSNNPAVSSSSSWSESWNSVLLSSQQPLGHESTHSTDSADRDHNTTFLQPKIQAMHHHHNVQAAFAPPLGKRAVRIAQQRTLAAGAAPIDATVTTTTTTTTRQFTAPHFTANKLVEPVAIRHGSPAKSFDSLQSLPTWMAHTSSDPMVEELVRDNALLRHEVAENNACIESLQQTIQELQTQVAELKQLPVGKISQIPVADMLDLMQTYGSEVSEHTNLSSAMTSGKRKVQKASIVRQFRRWNPNFHEFFRHEGGKWVPKLGQQGELDRRARNRAERRLRKVVGGKPSFHSDDEKPAKRAKKE